MYIHLFAVDIFAILLAFVRDNVTIHIDAVRFLITYNISLCKHVAVTHANA